MPSKPSLRLARSLAYCALLALAVGAGAACSESSPDPVVIELYPGEQAFQSLAVDAVSSDDELYTCNAKIVDTIVSDLDLSLESIGIEQLSSCAAQLKISVADNARPGRVRVRVEFSWTYYDAFFEEDRDDWSHEDVHIDILSPR